MLFSKTKAETLNWLGRQGFPVPEVVLFSVNEWEAHAPNIVRDTYARFHTAAQTLAVRSSAQCEDGMNHSLAGAFKSMLDVPGDDIGQIIRAIFAVREKLPGHADQIFIQPMVTDVIMSGVIMTRHLDDGSPYYVINYDDVSGRTDTITSGIGAGKTVLIYKGVSNEDFDSPRLKQVVNLALSLEKIYDFEPLDIEFALDNSLNIHLLQVRRICTDQSWNPQVVELVNSRIDYVASYIHTIMQRRFGLFGRRSILGVMPDWNPAEMIGIAPRPLALSLYKKLITQRNWSLAREHMGYRRLPPVDLMLSVGGRPYIDVRASFNSFLPKGLEDAICERLVNAWLDRLDENPNFHDKVEFEVVHTVADLDMEASFTERYPKLLRKQDFANYLTALTTLTNNALKPKGTLNEALQKIEKLHSIQKEAVKNAASPKGTQNPYKHIFRLNMLLEQCGILGTLPFAVIARHAFVAESLLRSAVRCNALSQERLETFKQSIHTVSSELTKDFQSVCAGLMPQDKFMDQYGHLRPGTYDILSLSYRERQGIFTDAAQTHTTGKTYSFHLTADEKVVLKNLLKKRGLHASPEVLLEYARKAIAGREYAKFIFTRHISDILNLLVAWGKALGLERKTLSMLSIDEVLDSVSSPLYSETGEYFRQRADSAMREYEAMRSLKLAYIIRSPRDVYIVPQHRSAPNFITSKIVQAPVIHIQNHDNESKDLRGCIVCIESADPGYDWIFTRNISGLVTRYGGTNSHMAIRCAEYGLPAAIGCGERIYAQVTQAESCLLDCAGKQVVPLGNPAMLSQSLGW